ncbi:MAG: hypothetical protein Q9213_001913 [Squamulea squamosa]
MTPTRAKEALGAKNLRIETKFRGNVRREESTEGPKEFLGEKDWAKRMKGNQGTKGKQAKKAPGIERSWMTEKYQADSTKFNERAEDQKPRMKYRRTNGKTNVPKGAVRKDRSMWNQHLDKVKPKMKEAMAEMDRERRREMSKDVDTENSRIMVTGVKVPPRLETRLRGPRTWQQKLAKRAGKKRREERRIRNNGNEEESGKRRPDMAKRKGR